MGDVIHTLPLAANARAAGAEVGWAIERKFSGLLEGNPSVDRVFVTDTPAWRRRPFSVESWRDARRLRLEMREFAPRFAIDAQGLWKSALVAKAAGASVVVGFARAARREPASALLNTIPVAPAPDVVHVVEKNLSLLEPAGVEVRVRAPDAGYLAALPSPDVETFLAAIPRPFALLHPGGGRAEKTWPEERFAHLARGLLRARDLTTVVSWGPGDERRAGRLRALLPKKPAMPLLGYAGLASVIRASALFVAGDTGPLHLADALGVPTLALFGPTDPARN